MDYLSPRVEHALKCLRDEMGWDAHGSRGGVTARGLDGRRYRVTPDARGWILITQVKNGRRWKRIGSAYGFQTSIARPNDSAPLVVLDGDPGLVLYPASEGKPCSA